MRRSFKELVKTGRRHREDDAHLIKVNFNAAHICGADRDHPEEAVFPSAQQYHPLVQDKQIRETFRHVRGDREQLACTIL